MARLVLEAFVGPCPEGMEACHFPDRDPANNQLENLRWDTHQANMVDKATHGTSLRGEQHNLCRTTADQVRAMRTEYALGRKVSDIARANNLNYQAVWKCVTRRSWSHVA